MLAPSNRSGKLFVHKDLYPEGIEAGSYVLPKDVTDDKEFVSAVEKLSTELKIPVNYLWAVMGFETGGTFDPAQKNAACSILRSAAF